MIQTPGKHVPPIKNRSSKHLYKLLKKRIPINLMSDSELRMHTAPEYVAELEKRRQLKKNKKK